MESGYVEMVAAPDSAAFRAMSCPYALPLTATPNDAEIRRLFCVGWKEGDAIPSVPGIKFTEDKQPVVTGRR